MEENIIMEEESSRKLIIKKWLFKPWLIVLVVIILMSGAVFAKKSKEKKNVDEKIEKIVYQVKSMKIDSEMNNVDNIKTVGSVTPESNVDIISLTNGTIRNLFFKVGDNVVLNSALASIHSSSVLTNHNNSQISLFNMQNNLDSTLSMTTDSIRQSELGVKTAEESVQAATIGLNTAKDNRFNSIELQERSNKNTKDNSINSYYSYLNTVNTALDQINYIIQAEDGAELAGIENTLSVRNLGALETARTNFKDAKASYLEISSISLNSDNITNYISSIVNVLDKTKIVVGNTIGVLDNTISSSEFSDSTLSSQRTAFFTLQGSVVSSLTSAKNTLSTLENLGATNKSESDALDNAVKSAESQLEVANIGLENSKIALSNAIQSQDKQILSAQTSLDSAQGQLDLVSSQVADLMVRAPISGQITSKLIEIGAEVSPGQKIAGIQQSERVKIEISLASRDIYRIKLGQSVKLNEDLEGQIILISPAADPITRKVKVEILFDNKEGELIPGTFIDVVIPVEKLKQTNLNSFFIPLRSVIITQNESYIYVAEEGVAKKRNVSTGEVEGALIEIVEGVNNGDYLITEGSKSLEDGDNVEITQ